MQARSEPPRVEYTLNLSSSLARKDKSKMELTESYKHSSLLQLGVIFSQSRVLDCYTSRIRNLQKMSTLHSKLVSFLLSVTHTGLDKHTVLDKHTSLLWNPYDIFSTSQKPIMKLKIKFHFLKKSIFRK